MAYALLKQGLIDTPVDVTSAGLGTVSGHPADPLAINLMAERGLDLKSHRSTEFTPTDGMNSDLILVMTTEMCEYVQEHWPLLQGRVYRLGHWGKFDIDDPHTQGEDAFRKALDLVDKGASQWLERLAP